MNDKAEKFELTPQVETLPVANDTSGLIAMAINADLDIAKLERLMEMQEREEEKTAKAAFNVAMAAVQKDIEPVIADAVNPQTNSRYSKLTTIVSTIAPVYTQEGFSVSFGTRECSSQKLIDEGWFRTTAELSHVGGYTKEYYVDLPADIRGPQGAINKTVIHGTKSAITYARVILMGLMFNFTTHEDVDDDGNGAGSMPPLADEEKAVRAERKPPPQATKEQRAQLQEYLDSFKEQLPASQRAYKQLESYLKDEKMSKKFAADTLINLKEYKVE